MELHGFGDASQRAYGACVYPRAQADGSWSASLVFSRAKMVPLKKLTLPRLELMGALLNARLVIMVHKALKLPGNVVCHYWTDSLVTLNMDSR